MLLHFSVLLGLPALCSVWLSSFPFLHAAWAMVRGTGSVFFGLSEAFKHLLLLVCPAVADPTYCADACHARDLDCLELLSGKSNLSGASKPTSN